MMYAAAAAGILVALCLVMVRAGLGPSIFDRALAANAVGTLATLLLAVLSFFDGRPEFVDLAIVYGLLNIIGTIAVLKFFRRGGLGDDGLSAPAAPADAPAAAVGPAPATLAPDQGAPAAPVTARTDTTA